MKKLCAAFVASFLATSSFAAPTTNTAYQPNVYVGVQAGLAYDNLQKNKTVYNLFQIKKDYNVNYGGRLFVGYNFTKHFGLETGFLMTDSHNIKVSMRHGVMPIGATKIGKFQINEKILDLTPRVNIPLDEKFTVYARGGVAYIDAFNGHVSKKNLNLVYGAGIDYNVTDKLSTGFAWSHYNGGSNKLDDLISGKAQPSLNFYGLSVSYKFHV
jgi:opacity protein-like surface antigen